MKQYKIVEITNKGKVLATCRTLALASYYLQIITQTDVLLKERYNWEKLPQYEIIEEIKEGDVI